MARGIATHPQNYISSNNDIYVFLGHDRNISPGPYQYQIGGVGNNWSSVSCLPGETRRTPLLVPLDSTARRPSGLILCVTITRASLT